MIRLARNFVDSIVSRIILIVIVCAFLFYGIFDAIRLGTNDTDAIKFKFAENIKSDEFFNLKNLYIKNLSSQNVFELTEDDSRQIDSLVLEKLINNRLMKYLSKLYNLQVSEEFLRSREKDFVENAQMFYLANYLKNNFAISDASDMVNAICIQKTFMNSYANASLSKEMYNFFNQARVFDNFYLNFDDVKITTENIGDSEIENFYNENKDIFTNPEKRNVEYVFINFNTDEATKFSNIKKIDDEIASGKDLNEIAAQYKQKVINLGELTFQQIENHEKEIIKNAATEIFDLAENETSYPKEIDGGVLLFMAKSIKPSKLQELSEVRNIVFDEIVKKIKITETKRVIANFKEESLKDIHDIENIAKKYSIKKIGSNIDVSRNDYEDNEKYKNSKNLVESRVFDTKLGEFSDAYIDKKGVGLFLFKLSKVKKDDKLSKSDKEGQEIVYKNLVQMSVFEDLLHYVKNINDIKINKDFK